LRLSWRPYGVGVLALGASIALIGCGSGGSTTDACDPYGKDMIALGVARRPLDRAGAGIEKALKANMATFRDTGSLASIPEVRAALVRWSRAADAYLADVRGIPMNTPLGEALVDRIAEFTPKAQALLTGVARGNVTTAQFIARFDDLNAELVTDFSAELESRAPRECVGTDPDTGEVGIGRSSE
jgi:hypothetical protein